MATQTQWESTPHFDLPTPPIHYSPSRYPPSRSFEGYGMSNPFPLPDTTNSHYLIKSPAGDPFHPSTPRRSSAVSYTSSSHTSELGGGYETVSSPTTSTSSINFTTHLDSSYGGSSYAHPLVSASASGTIPYLHSPLENVQLEYSGDRNGSISHSAGGGTGYYSPTTSMREEKSWFSELQNSFLLHQSTLGPSSTSFHSSPSESNGFRPASSSIHPASSARINSFSPYEKGTLERRRSLGSNLSPLTSFPGHSISKNRQSLSRKEFRLNLVGPLGTGH